jgi:hypothetical protein
VKILEKIRKSGYRNKIKGNMSKQPGNAINNGNTGKVPPESGIAGIG